MKSLNVFKFSLFFAFVGVNPAMGAIDYNRGLCVPRGSLVDVNHAVVTIANDLVDGRPVLDLSNHMFFSPYGNTHLLFGLDLAGAMELNRIGVHRHGVIATYQNFMQGHYIPKIEVLCVAENLTLNPIEFTLSKSATYPLKWNVDNCRRANRAAQEEADRSCFSAGRLTPAQKVEILVETCEFRSNTIFENYSARYLCSSKIHDGEAKPTSKSARDEAQGWHFRSNRRR